MALERQNFPERYFPLSEYHARWKKVEREMKRRKYDIALVWGKTAGTYERAMEILWLTNYFSNHSGQEPDSALWNARGYSCAILEPGKEPELHGDEPEARYDLIATRNYRGHMDTVKGVADALKKRKVRGRVAFVGSDCLPVKYARQLEEQTPGIEYVYDDDLIRVCRRIKSPRELDLFREAGQMVSSAQNRLAESLYFGKSAAEAAAEAAHELYRRGGFWHRIPISFGDTIKYLERDPMYGFSQDAPEKGQLVHFWIYGPVHQGYWLDPGRTLVVGGKPTKAQRALMEDSYAISQAVLNMVKPGVKVKDVARKAEKVKQSFKCDPDYNEVMWPYYGHGNGMLWEPPFLNEDACGDDEIFEEGMVASAESFMTRRGLGSAGWEENYILTKTGIEVITKTPVFWF